MKKLFFILIYTVSSRTRCGIQKYKKYWIPAFAGMTMLIYLALPGRVFAATEFISIVDTGGASDSDYSTLATWELGLGTNLTAPSTLVFSGVVTGTAPIDNSSVTLYRSGASTGVGATVVHTAKTNTKILLKNVSDPAYGFTTGDEWRINASNLFTIDATTPDQPQVTAKCRATTGAADTTAVTIDGWDTDATHYIKIWTDPSENYRHNGKWDVGKYRLETSGGYVNSIENKEIYTKIDGIQIKATYSVAGTRVILVNANDTSISNSIIVGAPSAAVFGYGINFSSGGGGAWNNIIYNINTVTNGGYGISDVVGSYTYNNTVTNWQIGIYSNYHAMVAKNNLSYNNTDNYAVNSEWAAGCTNNLSGPGTDPQIPATNKRDGVTVTFADTYNQDFHLDSSDTGAKNQGTILYDSGDDANLNFTTDIDGNARPAPAGAGWDIGADENVAKIYRSVGAGATSPLAWGGTADSSYGNMTISGLIATFWRPLPDNVGVGDALQYDTDNTGGIDKIVFITKRIDDTHYSVRKADGTAPDATTSLPNSTWSIFRAYTSLSNAEAGTENTGIAVAVVNFDAGNVNLTTNNLQWNIACYAGQSGAADTAAVEISGWVTTADNYIRVYTPTRTDEVGTSQRHSGKWDTGKYYLETTFTTNNHSAVAVQTEYVRIEGIQIRTICNGDMTGGYVVGIYVNPSGTSSTADVRISNNIVRYTLSSGVVTYNDGIYVDGTGWVVKIWNTIVYDIQGSSVGKGIATGTVGTPTIYAYNCTVLNCMSGFLHNVGTFVVKNSLSKSIYVGFDINVPSYDLSSDYNLSVNDSTAPGSHSRHEGVSFVDETNNDYHLAPGDAGARNFGADLTNDLYLPITTDIDSSGSIDGKSCDAVYQDSCYTRPGPAPAGAGFDIGADELITKIYRSVGVGTTAAIISGTSVSISLTISGNTGTFATWPTSADFGVGDVIRYDSDNNGSLDSTAFISAIDSTAKTATLQSSTGASPTAMAVGDYDWKLYRAYTRLYDWEEGTENVGIGVTFDAGNRDIATNSEQWNVACYANSGTAPDTTAVTINGWTTAQQNYIKIYTPTLSSEVTTSQRHQGKWDDTKYKLLFSPTTSGQSVLSIVGNYVRIEGLQVNLNASAYDGTFGIFVSDTLGLSAADVRISNNIVKETAYSSGAQHLGIYAAGGNSVKVWNNIAYDLNYSNYAIYGLGTYYFYNNTARSSTFGMWPNSFSGTAILKNNLFSSISFQVAPGTYSAGTDYNATDAGSMVYSGGGTHDRVSQTFSFLDSTNKDFHLATTDTAAKDAGADLSQDLYLPIMNDVDGQQKLSFGSLGSLASYSQPDIGADEAATAIYRSLAPSATTAIASGTSPANSMIIAGTSVTFGTAPGDTIGVGDAIQYDSDNNGSIDSVAFITYRTDSTHYIIQDRTGGTPTSTSATDYDWSIYRAYTSLQNATGSSTSGTENTGIADAVEHFDIDWSASHGKNIYTNNQQWNVSAYANGTTEDTTALTIGTAWTTYPTNYIRVYTPTATTEVGTSQRHQGKWDDSKYNLSVTNDYNLTTNVEFIKIDGLQLKQTYNNYGWGYTLGYGYAMRPGAQWEFSNNIIRGAMSGSSNNFYGIRFATNNTGTNIAKIWNNIIYGYYLSSTNSGTGIYAPSGVGWNYYVYNNTFYNNYLGIEGGNSLLAKNNISQNSTDGYNGTFASGSDYNISDIAGDTTGISASYRSGLATTVAFSDSANKDFHLAANDTAARNSGADLSSDPWIPASAGMTSDIDGHTRPAPSGAGWDIGADEGATAIYYSVGQSTATDFKVASNVTVNGYTATFTTAQTGNIGVGDIVTYDGGSCNITGKTSTLIWSCSNVTGGTAPQVSGVAVTSIKRAFASLNSAMGGSTAPQFLNTTDLKTNNYQLNIPCYMDSGTQPDTTAVTIQGYTTAVPNYIKVYTPNNTTTEANQSQRHQGKWDEGKYKIETSVDNNSISIRLDNVKIDGLQLKLPAGGWSIGAISIASSKVYISNNIIKDAAATSYHYGIITAYPGSSIYIYDNTIYDFSNLTWGRGIYNVNASNVYLYNNTIFNCHEGIANNSGTVVAKNNIYQSNGISGADGYTGSLTSSDYNISDQASDAPSASYRNNLATTVTFADTTNKDYHLGIGDTAAQNVGADLNADSNFAFSTDIDGNTRNLNSRGWDIGADESATAIYYSVGQSSSDLKTGSPTLSIDSSGNGTLSVAQTGNMGVGDYIEYGTSPYAKAYISGKTSSTVWTVQSATGSMLGIATTEPVNSIKHAYTTLSGAIAGASGATMMNTTDLYTNNYQLNVPCYYDSAADTTAVSISGYTTYSTNYIKVYTPTSTTTEANNSQRHSGKWDDGKYRLETSADVITIVEDFTIIDGLQIKRTSNSSGYSGIKIAAGRGGNVYVSNNIIKGTNSGYGILYYSSNLGTGYVYNNIIYDFVRGFYTYQVAYLYNNTLINNTYGITSSNSQPIAKNNIVQGSTDGYYVSNSSDYNISDIAGDSPGAHSKNSTTVSFVDSANYDFHLAESDTSARNAGADLSSDVWIPASAGMTSDIDGHARPAPAGAGWDIGADEGSTYIYYSVGQNTDDHKTLGVGGSTPTITLSGYAATLDVAQTAPNMGVGDRITYTGGSCYITSKTNDDKMHWNCQNATGGTAPQVSSVSVTTISHAFPSLSEALPYGAGGAKGAGYLNTTDLYTGNYVLNIPCYYDTGADTTAAAIGGWTTAANNYIKAYTPTNINSESNASQRHNGKWDDGKYSLVVNRNSDGVIFNQIDFINFEGLQIENTADASANSTLGIRINNSLYGNINISNNIIRYMQAGSPDSSDDGIYLEGAKGVTKIWNNIIYNFGTALSNEYGLTDNTYYIYNNTLQGNTRGVVIQTVGSAYAYLKNNIVKGSGNTNAYVGTFATGTDYNATDGTDDIGQGTHNKISQTFSFVDEANDDFHLVPNDTAALNSGVDLSADVWIPASAGMTLDIDGQTRGGWCIGADEFIDIMNKMKGTVRTKGNVRFK